MRVLVACERSQQVALAFRARGHDAYSCDLSPSAGGYPQWHIQADARGVLKDGWALLVAHPPCTRLANSGGRWLPKRMLWKELDAAAALFLDFWNAPIEKIVVENPVPHAYAVEAIGRRYDQLIQPHFFGEEQFKATCLWLKGVPPLRRTHFMEVPKYGTPAYKAWSAVHRAPQSRGRADKRAETLPGVANAFAEQWGSLG